MEFYYVSSEEVSGFNTLYTEREGMMFKILMKSGCRVDSSTFKDIFMLMFEAKKLADYHVRKLYGDCYEVSRGTA